MKKVSSINSFFKRINQSSSSLPVGGVSPGSGNTAPLSSSTQVTGVEYDPEDSFFSTTPLSTPSSSHSSLPTVGGTVVDQHNVDGAASSSSAAQPHQSQQTMAVFAEQILAATNNLAIDNYIFSPRTSPAGSLRDDDAPNDCAADEAEPHAPPEVIKSALIISTETVAPNHKQPYTAYKIQVETNRTMYNVLRRYSEFLEFDLKLHAAYPLSRLPFPPKKTFGKMNNEFIEQRKDHLQQFMTALFTHATLVNLPNDPLVVAFFARSSTDMRHDTVSPMRNNGLTADDLIVKYIISTLPFWSDNLDYRSLLSLTETCNYLMNTVSHYSDLWRRHYWRQYNALHFGVSRACSCSADLGGNVVPPRDRSNNNSRRDNSLSGSQSGSPSPFNHINHAFNSLNSSFNNINNPFTSIIKRNHQKQRSLDHSSSSLNNSGSGIPNNNNNHNMLNQSSSSLKTSPHLGNSPANSSSSLNTDTVEYSRQLFLQMLSVHHYIRTSADSHRLSDCDCMAPKFKGTIIGMPNITSSFLQSFHTEFKGANNQQPHQNKFQSLTSSADLDQNQQQLQQQQQSNGLQVSGERPPLSMSASSDPIHLSSSVSSTSESVDIDSASNSVPPANSAHTTSTTTFKVSHIVYNGRLLCVSTQDSTNLSKEERKYNLSLSHFVVLVFSLIDEASFEAIGEWYEEVKQMCPESPIILVGLQRDLREKVSESKPTVSYQQGFQLSQRIPNCVGYFESPSASDGVGGWRLSLLSELASHLVNHFRHVFVQNGHNNNHSSSNNKKNIQTIKTSFLSKIFPKYPEEVLFKTLNNNDGDVEKCLELLAQDYGSFLESSEDRSRKSMQIRRQSIDKSVGSVVSSWVSPPTSWSESPSSPLRQSVKISESQINSLVEKLKKNCDQFSRGFLRKKNQSQDQQAEIVLSFLREMGTQLKSSQVFSPHVQNGEADEDLTSLPLSEIENHLYTTIYKAVFATSESLEKDELLTDRMNKLVFVEPQHLEINEMHWNKDLWTAAERELLNLNELSSPSQKLECILNCCKIILFLLSNSESPGGADDFLPHLIYVVIHSKVPNLFSNFEFTSKFCNTELLKMERYYYFTTFGIAVTFIENIDVKHLKIDPDEFNAYMSGKKKYVRRDTLSSDDAVRAKIMQSIGDGLEQNTSSSPASTATAPSSPSR
ncbi:hypothetical protein SAMD00019534_077590 [Acytostelium subglobosum LB1]|uniref:hypothetical protein n=1 Tax=Acytostelium subglobosum LB1 TaxID=1410327 RepID=UPI000644E428|nr:hypothetical protein SAMD00019534_077590 [Acytostelium subglobosum LB1]GAM24584.1 hypothetical protein SAMD00019534_077590 [Acytostelium subglobosum LB1]|eukprot:XP_012752253.1 hypothetical protein SAMD00019534_077590 [Acytostelium subglobosum LB1]